MSILPEAFKKAPEESEHSKEEFKYPLGRKLNLIDISLFLPFTIKSKT
jgi:hypothetical protein